jgi:hypothetical protein
VAPSGIVLRPLVLPDPASGVIAEPDEPPPALPVAPEAQVLVVEPDITPPPSKEVLDPDIPVPDIPVLDPEVPVLVVVAHDVVLESGLNPPPSSSVAPIGMPTGPDGEELKFIEPAGDVAPMPGVGAVCANPLLQSTRKMTAAMARSRRIEPSVCLRAGRAAFIVFGFPTIELESVRRFQETLR